MVEEVRLIPLGGVGEIGMNCMAVECDGHIFVIDCGIAFSGPEFGTEVMRADFRWLHERRDRVRAAVVTHGHEDHIGALPYFLREFPVPVYGARYALELLRERAARDPFPLTKVTPLEDGQRFVVGRIEIEPVRVTHSTPESFGLVLRTPAGVIFHTGDFRLAEGRKPNDRLLERVQALATEGVRLLMSDSTNVDVERHDHGETEVAETLEEVVANATHRVVVALFASNVERLGAVLAAAHKHGRRACLLGRSVELHARVAERLGALRSPLPTYVAPERAAGVPRNELLVVATGTQGEPPAAAALLALGRHPHMQLEEHDTVVLSSRTIPGNELRLEAMVDAFEKQGIDVVTTRTHRTIHASGHASRHELAQLIAAARPHTLMPVHGTYRHMKRHAELATSLGVTAVVLAPNGTVVELDRHGARIVDRIECAPVHLENGIPVDPSTLAERTQLARHGAACVVVFIDPEERVSAQLPELRTYGVFDPTQHPSLVDEACRYVHTHLRALDPPRTDRARFLEDAAARSLRRFFRTRLGIRPTAIGMAIRTS